MIGELAMGRSVTRELQEFECEPVIDQPNIVGVADFELHVEKISSGSFLRVRLPYTLLSEYRLNIFRRKNISRHCFVKYWTFLGQFTSIRFIVCPDFGDNAFY
jgi:hypothetical protein